MARPASSPKRLAVERAVEGEEPQLPAGFVLEGLDLGAGVAEAARVGGDGDLVFGHRDPVGDRLGRGQDAACRLRGRMSMVP